MKKNLFKIFFGCLTLLGFVACDQEDGTFDNQVLIKQTTNVATILLKGNDTAAGSFQVQMPKTEGYDVKCIVGVDANKLNTYNQAYNAKAVLLGQEYYEISQKELIIAAGTVVSPDVEISFQKLDELDKDNLYVLPVVITSNQISVLESKSTVYYVLKGAALINVVADLNENNVYVDWKNPTDFQNMTTFTAEAFIYAHTFDKMISTLMGIEGKFLLRFGDAGIPPNQLQIATSRGNYSSSDLQIPTKAWTHIAMTYDAEAQMIEVYINGKKMYSTQTANIGAVNWGVPHSDESDGKPRCFWIGYSYDNNRYLNANIAECRIWNRVLQSEEINAKNHFYYVDPSSEGLIAYWKFDDGGGVNIKDHSLNGNDATASGTLTWNQVQLP